MPTSEGNFDEEQDFSFFENSSPQIVYYLQWLNLALTWQLKLTLPRETTEHHVSTGVMPLKDTRNIRQTQMENPLSGKWEGRRDWIL